MKAIMLIFSLYLLALPVVSNAMYDNCIDEQYQVVDQQSSEDHQDDTCGDYCNCACCIHFVSMYHQTLLSFGVKALHKKNLLTHYLSISLPSNYFGNIWQPPRVG